MTDRDPLSRLLARHRASNGRSTNMSRSERFLDDYSIARILDASLGVLAALRTLTAVTEDVVRARRDRLLERTSGASTPRSQHKSTDRERIPLTY